MEKLEEHRSRKYIQLSEPKEVDSFDINKAGGKRFSFLKDLGIVEYKKTFRIWLREFPRPIFILCVEDGEILAWVYTEEWETSARDGEPIYVLRAIETAKELRNKRIGKRLLMLIAKETPGYLITKPINQGARRFFLTNEFMEKDDLERKPIDLQKHPGYLILPPYKKKRLLDEYDQYFD